MLHAKQVNVCYKMLETMFSCATLDVKCYTLNGFPGSSVGPPWATSVLFGGSGWLSEPTVATKNGLHANRVFGRQICYTLSTAS